MAPTTKLGQAKARSFLQVSQIGAGAQALQLYSAAFPGILQSARSKVAQLVLKQASLWDAGAAYSTLMGYATAQAPHVHMKKLNK